MTTLAEEKPSFGKRVLRGLGWFLKFLLRLLFVIVIGGALGLGLYLAAVYGVRLFNTQLVQPVRDNTQRLDDLEAYRASDLIALDQHLSSLQEQVDILITQGDNQRESIDSITQRMTYVEKDLSDALANLEILQVDVDAVVAETRKMTPRLDTALDGLDAVEGTSETLMEALTALEGEVAELTARVDDDAAVKVLRNDVMLLKAMESLTRARLFLSQENTGLASQEISSARDTLLVLLGMVPDFQKDTVQAILQRLDLARENLTPAPTVAVDDLEAAWKLLLIGLPATALQGTSLSIVPTATLTATGALSPTLAITATVVPTVTTVITP